MQIAIESRDLGIQFTWFFVDLRDRVIRVIRQPPQSETNKQDAHKQQAPLAGVIYDPVA